jgi:hypothetical protein
LNFLLRYFICGGALAVVLDPSSNAISNLASTDISDEAEGRGGAFVVVVVAPAAAPVAGGGGPLCLNGHADPLVHDALKKNQHAGCLGK